MFKFKPEDFRDICANSKVSSYDVAFIANMVLQAHLKQCPTVYANESDQRFWGLPDATGQIIPKEHDLQAKLVDIKKNK